MLPSSFVHDQFYRLSFVVGKVDGKKLAVELGPFHVIFGVTTVAKFADIVPALEELMRSEEPVDWRQIHKRLKQRYKPQQEHVLAIVSSDATDKEVVETGLVFLRSVLNKGGERAMSMLHHPLIYRALSDTIPLIDLGETRN